MKKRVFLLLAVALLSVCFFAITVGASDIYTDFTRSGANGENPIFSIRGYAVNEAGGSICVEYDVDVEALESYEQATGEKLEFGVVVSRAGNLIDGKPLDADGNVVGIDTTKVHKADLSGSKNSLITLILHGLTEEQYNEGIVMALYVKGLDGIQYVTDDVASEAPTSVSYNSVLEEVENPSTGGGNTPEVEEPVNPPIEPPVAPEEPEVPVPTITEVKVGNIVYAIDGVTEPAYDRIKQQNASNADYKSGSSESTSMYMIMARLIAGGGSSLGMPAAADFMSHYLGNTGKNYTINVAGMMADDSGALSCRNTAINNALRAAEQLAVEGLSLTIGQLTEGHPMQWQLATQNWQYSLGSYFDDVDVTNLTVTEVNGVKTYTADITYIVTDFYNWDTNDYNKFKDIISPHQLHELHKAGKAREFMSYGEITYKSVTWTEGQDASAIAGLK